MRRGIPSAVAVGACLVALSASAADAPDDASEETPPEAAPPATAQPTPTPTVTTTTEPAAHASGWRTEVSGYFRTPASIGISSRPPPDDKTGPASTQLSYGPNRTIDSNYYSFAYTRLQEQDWAELFVHERKAHVDAAIGWMGYWYQGAGFRNPDASWAPGLAYISLDSDVKLGAYRPNVALTVGAWWPRFGYFEKYDTYTLGRFRQLGEQFKVTAPLTPDVTVSLVEGFGTNRDGSFNYLSPPFYGAIVGLDLLTWWNLQLVYDKYLDVALHYNTEWTADPNLEQQSTPGDKSFQAAAKAHLTVAGFEAHLRAPGWGHLWISPSYLVVRNGWALGSAGTEVMHGLGGAGIATNYMAWSGSPTDSAGTGSMINFGFLYENSLSNLQGRTPGSVLPDLTLSLFGLYVGARLSLPAGSTLTQDGIRQLKYGADLTLQSLDWLAFMVRGDVVNYDLDHPAYLFASLTGRVQVASHFLSSERIYLQYSRYKYGDKMVLNGTWPWGQSLVAGSSVTQQGPYAGLTPDRNVVKLQAEIAF
jgi:hypothetical protein